MNIYTPDELRTKIASHDYGAELMLQHAMANIERLEADARGLRAFAQGVMCSWPHGDVDGVELQELAINHGLLRPETRHERCGESCVCAESVYPDEWADGVTCYRRTPLLKDDQAMKDTP